MKPKLRPALALLFCAPFMCMGANGMTIFTNFLQNGNEFEILEMPPEALLFGPLQHDLKLKPADNSSAWQRTLEAEEADLKEVLQKNGKSELEVEQAVFAYGEMRDAMDQAPTDGSRKAFDISLYKDVLAHVPLEFELYVRGAAAFHNQDFPTATEQWQKILSLPPDQRLFRSTWAAFMLGKVAIKAQDKSAAAHFIACRDLAQKGFKDTLGLGVDSLRWQAGSELELGDVKSSIRHLQEAEKTSGRAEGFSFIGVCSVALGKDPIDPELVKDPVCRSIITSHAAFGEPEQAARWCAAVEASGIELPPAEAEALSLVAYHCGYLDTARRLLDRSRSRAIAGDWLSSKLNLWYDNLPEAVDDLRRVVSRLSIEAAKTPLSDEVSLFIESLNRRANSELGVLLLARGEFVESIEAFARGGSWHDLAYLAERVLTLTEVRDFYEANKDSPILAADGNGQSLRRHLASLLARRHARAGFWDKAQDYLRDASLPSQNGLIESLVSYRDHLEHGLDEKNDQKDRAVHLFLAAKILSIKGKDFMGSELQPDGLLNGPQENSWDPLAWRTVMRSNPNIPETTFTVAVQALIPDVVGLFFPSNDEMVRVAGSSVLPNKTAHHQWHVLELMRQSAELLPDNDPLLARVLWEAATLSKTLNETDQTQEMITLVIERCGDLPLGKQTKDQGKVPSEPPLIPEVLEKETR